MDAPIIITEDLILELLSAPKEICSPPKIKEKQNGKHKENGFELKSIDGKYCFGVFLRQNIELPENFSIGCIWRRDEERNVILARYNGDHGEHRNFLTGEKFEGCHVHTVSIEALENGIKTENNASLTRKYTTLEEALLCFFQDLKVENFKQYFPNITQGTLF